MCSFLCEHSFQLLEQRSKLLSKMIVSFCIPTSSKWEFLLFPCWSAFGSASISHFGHSSRYVVVSPCFNWQFLIWYWVSFNMLIWYLYVFPHPICWGKVAKLKLSLSTMVWMFMSHQNSHVEILMPDEVVLLVDLCQGLMPWWWNLHKWE